MVTRKIFILLLAVMAIASSLYSQEEIKTFSKSIDVNPDVYLMMKNKYGKIEISGSEANKIIIDAKIRAKGEGAKEFIEAVMIKLNESPSNVNVTTLYPSISSKNNFSYGVDYTVKVPNKARIKVENEFGSTSVNNVYGDVDLDVTYGSIDLIKCFSKNLVSGKFSSISATELGADSRISNSYGKVKIIGAKGDLEVTGSFGDCEIKNINGNLTVTNGYGSIFAENVEGRASLSNQFGRISAKNIKGTIDITNKNSEIKLENIESGRVTNSFGAIVISDVKGKSGMNVTNKNGSIRIKRCNSNVHLQSSFDFIELKEISGRIDLSSNNCNIRLSDVSGDIKLENTFGSVEIESISGDVNARNKSGRISIADIKKLGKSYILENEFGPISVEFPKNLSAEIYALTTFGSINSEVTLDYTKTTSKMEGKGKIADGYSKVRLETRNAHIDISLSGVEVKQ